MENDPQVGQPKQKVTLAEERMKATPGDADSWFDSSDSSFSGMDSDPQNEEQSSISKEQVRRVECAEKQIHQQQQKTFPKDSKEQSPKQRLNDPDKVEYMEKQFLTFSHNVESRFLVLLRIMTRSKAVDLLQVGNLKKGEGFIDFHSKGSKIIIRTTSKDKANQAINNISDYIDDLNILKLQVPAGLAYKLENFCWIRRELRKRQIFIIGLQDHKRLRELYIGGHIKMPQLRKIQQQLKNYRTYSFELRLFRNKRSYKLILNEIFGTDTMRQALLRFNKVNMVQIDRKGKDSCIKCYLNANSKADISGVEYQQFIYKMVKKFFVLTLVLKKEKFYPKLQVPEHPQIIFKFIKERNAGVDYLFVICPNAVFLKEANFISKQLEQIGQSIVGARFFNYIEPNFKYFYFDSAAYIVRKFPQNNTYSMCVSAKTKEGKVFQWRETFNLVLEIKGRYYEIEESLIVD